MVSKKLTTLAIAAVAGLGALALSVESASAKGGHHGGGWGHHGGHHGGWRRHGWGWGYPSVYVGAYGYGDYCFYNRRGRLVCTY